MVLNRRSFIGKIVVGIIGLVVLDAYWLEPYGIEWTEFDLNRDSSNKIKAIHLTDLHLRSIGAYHRSITKKINNEKPDVLFITGDTINHNGHFPFLIAFLDLIDAKIPKIAILGNKEYSGKVDLEKLKAVFETYNGTLLINQSQLFAVRNRKINVVGLDDYVYSTPDFELATKGIDKSQLVIVLNHCPAYRKQIDELGEKLHLKSHLILAGHTHGGQITYFGKPIYTPYGSAHYVKGWYNNEHSKMYVSRGVGTAIMPIRFACRSEASIFYI